MALRGFKFETDVGQDGTVTLKLPLPAGTRVEIVVLACELDDVSDLVQDSTRMNKTDQEYLRSPFGKY